MFAHVVFIDEAAEPVLLPNEVSLPVEVIVIVEASEITDLLFVNCFSANLMSCHLTFHQESFSSASQTIRL